MTDQTKTEPQDAKRRFEEFMARLAANSQFNIVPPSGQGFILPAPAGVPKPPGGAD
jgi:hypothetical protein